MNITNNDGDTVPQKSTQVVPPEDNEIPLMDAPDAPYDDMASNADGSAGKYQPQWPIARGLSWGLGIATIAVLAWALFELRLGFEHSDSLERARRLLISCLFIQCALGFVIIWRIIGVWRSQSKELASSRLFRRVIGFSMFVAGGPSVVMSIVAILVLTLGLQGWFGQRVGQVVSQALATADSFLNEHVATKVAQSLRLSNARMETLEGPQLLTQVLTQADFDDAAQDFVNRTGIDSVVWFNAEREILSQGGLPLQSELNELVSEQAIADLDARVLLEDNYILVLSEPDAQVFISVVRHLDDEDLYFLTVDALHPSIIQRQQITLEAAKSFRVQSANVSEFTFIFILLFAVLAFSLTLFAAWAALRLGIDIARPILKITTAAEALGQGGWSTRVPVNKPGRRNELDSLALAFNQMAGDLGQQQAALYEANAKAEERRRFTEAVLAGVSAGVIGLDAKGNIDLPNETASDLLDQNLSEWVGLPLASVAPAFMSLFEAAHEDPTGVFTEEITITRRNGSPRQLMTNAVAEAPNGVIEGYVFTFDDVTDLHLAQRRAAWSDVARRIAHEIKNPLTPIQLSAERLRRRYLKEIDNNPELFSELVNTIIRQVGEIGRMVDEFSGFARMPEPRMNEQDIRVVVRQAVFLQANAFPQVEVKAQVGETELPLNVDEQLMNQAIINLVKNAAESLEAQIAEGKLDQGYVEVSVLNTPDPEHADIRGPRIEVRDNGSGYPVELLPKLMEPYVTTREKGTGLGLAIVRKVMEDHQGQLKLLNGNSQENLCGARAVLLFCQ